MKTLLIVIGCVIGYFLFVVVVGHYLHRNQKYYPVPNKEEENE